MSFYIVESQASNHAVREAACACIAELGTKVSPDRLRTHIGSLVGALLDCFKDDSWPVRDGELLSYDKRSIEWSQRNDWSIEFRVPHVLIIIHVHVHQSFCGPNWLKNG